MAVDQHVTPEADLVCDPDNDGRLLANGNWTLSNVQFLSTRIDHFASKTFKLDASGISRLDASGALLLEKLFCQTGQSASDARLTGQWYSLFEALGFSCEDSAASKPESGQKWRQLLASLGQASVKVSQNLIEAVNFLGITIHRLVRTLLQPRRLRLTSTVYHMEQTGLDAAPLLVLLAGLVGAVVAFLGATVLRDFGAELFIIDLVTFAFLREFGVLLAAILLAGRTASAFCAQIGMMKSREELDAIRTLGLDQIEVLVLPRLLALLISLPLLAFIATLAGLAGGLVVSVLMLDINFSVFIERVEQSISLQHYLVGMLKAPVFAIAIALIGCLEGFRVSGSTRSVGEHTTTAVVRSLTMVIVLDAIAAIYFMELGW